MDIQPDFPDAHRNRASAYLLRGDFDLGWAEYEWRFTEDDIPHPSFSQPLWDGSELHGKTILLHAEQGLGDTLQFIRYAALVKQRCGRVVVECQSPIMRLVATVAGIDHLVARGADLPSFDAQIPLLSLPRVFRTSVATIPADIPYMHAEPPLVECWRQELGHIQGLKVGIAWQGNRHYHHDEKRSIPLKNFEPLGRVAGVHFISLQKGWGSEQLRDVAARWPVIDLEARLGSDAESFANIAAVMKHLDLVITCDTAIGHLAGALGVPVWVALPFAPDWRWLIKREDSPWYPTLRLFRQSRIGAWGDVIDLMAVELKALKAPPQTAADTNALSAQAEKHLAEGHFAAAEIDFRQVIRATPENAQRHNCLGIALAQQNKLGEAVAAFQRALRLRPDHPEAHNNLGNALRTLGDLPNAVTHCRLALQSRPAFAEAHNNLGVALQLQGKSEEAASHFREAHRLKPHLAEADGNLGNLLRDSGHFDDALACYQRALANGPNKTADTHLNRALLWLAWANGIAAGRSSNGAWQTQEMPRPTYSQPRGTARISVARQSCLMPNRALAIPCSSCVMPRWSSNAEAP